MKKTIAMLLALCLLAGALPAAPAEEFGDITLAPAEDAGLEAVDAGEAMPGVVTEGLLADGLTEGEAADETPAEETPAAPEAVGDGPRYARLAGDAPLYADLSENRPAATLPGGCCLLVLGDAGGRVAVAFAAEGRAVTGYVPGESVVALDEAEAAALVAGLAAGGEVLLYEGDLDRPLPGVEADWAEENDGEEPVEETPTEEPVEDTPIEEPVEGGHGEETTSEEPVEGGDGEETTSPDTADAVPPSPEGEGLEEPVEDEPVVDSPEEGDALPVDEAEDAPAQGADDPAVTGGPGADSDPTGEGPDAGSDPAGADDPADGSGPDAGLDPQATLAELSPEEAGDPDTGEAEVLTLECRVECTTESSLDDDALFAGYASRFFGTNQRQVRRTMATENAGEHLTGNSRLVYDLIKAEVLKVAAGQRRSTVFTLPVSALLDRTSFSATELGLNIPGTVLTDNDKYQMKKAFLAQLGFDFQFVYDCVWVDCTYEMFWLDRYVHCPTMELDIYTPGKRQNGDYVVYVDDDACLRFVFSVMDVYADGDQYTMNTSMIERARVAAQNAKAIVRRYSGECDYVKMYAYAMEICDRVDYNSEAAGTRWWEDNLQMQDAWKLIWVFDGDPNTNVVCEGYAVAFTYLCELSDFTGGARCYQISGDAGGGHSWNIVRMDDGKSYMVDVTWMDGEWNNATGRLVDWINEERGSLFLVGAREGSVEGGFDVNYRVGNRTTFRTYWDNFRAVYPASVLTLAQTKYRLTGWQTIQGKTYYFDKRGKYLTGWQEIDGERRFFESDGVYHARHVSVDDHAVDATCSSDGLTAGSHCVVCGEVLTEQTVVPGGHSWGAASYTWAEDNSSVTARRVCGRDPGHVQTETVSTQVEAIAPTCTAMGGTRYTATFNNAAFETQTRAVEDIPATGHTPVDDPAVAATCTEDGLTAGQHCSACSAVLTEQQTVPATGHSWGEVEYTWAEDDGSVTARRVCAHDAKHVQTETVQPVAAVAQAATCTAKGRTKYTATFQNAAFEAQTRTLEDIPARGHAPVTDHAVAATCTEDGLTAGSHCSVCGKVLTEQQTVPAKGHTPVTDAAVAATCLSSGLTAGTHCSVCGAVLTKQQTVPAKGHSWGAVSYTWAEDNSSVTARRVCAHDAKHVQTEIVQTTSVVALKPTCTAKGKTKYTATFKNAAFAAQSRTVADIPALGHSWGAVSYSWAGDNTSVTARRVCAHDAKHVQTETVQTTSVVALKPTCTVKGKTKYTAKFTNAAFAAQTRTVADIPVLGHSWGEAEYTWADDNTGVTARRVCAHDAKHVQTETVQTTSVVALNPTCTAKGKTKYTAKFTNAAFAAQTRAVADIPANGHSPVTDAAVAPTYTRTGLTEGSHCEVCGKVLVKQKAVAKKKVPADCVLLTKNLTRTLKAGRKLTILLDGVTAKSYKSGKTAVATVSKKGVVTAKLAGTAKITVTLKGGGKLVLTVKVTDPLAPERVQLKQGRTGTMKVGEKLALTPVLKPANARTALTWTSSDASVATVTQKGVVKALKKGTVIIMATAANGKKASIKIKVK